MDPNPVELPPISDVLFTSWTTAWAPNALMAATTLGYVLLLRRGVPRGARLGPLTCWALAMVGLALAFNSSISVYSDALFWSHMVQHLLLIMVVPPFLVWARPWSLVPARGGRTVQQVLDGSRLWRAVTSPVVSVPLYAAAVVLTHLTSFQEMALTHPVLRVPENMLYLVSGYLLFAELVRGGRQTRRIPDLLRIATLIAAMGADTLAGVALMLTRHPVAPAYAASHPGWGPGALADQSAAGAVMWVFGDVVMMILLTVVGVEWGTRGDDGGAGVWLESVRRREMLGDAADDAPDGPVIDFDQAALDAYNERLALIHHRDVEEGRRQ